MSEKVVCRLKLTVTGVRVDGVLEWKEEIWTEGVRQQMAWGADLRDYEPEMCSAGVAALEAYKGQCWEARQKAKGEE